MVENTVCLRYEAASLGKQFPEILKEKSVFTSMGLEVQRELKVLLLLHGSTVLVGPWPPSRPSSSHLFCAHVSSSLWHPSSSGHPSHRPSTLTLVFLHSYFLLACSDKLRTFHVAIHISFFNPFPRPCCCRRSDQFLPLLGSWTVLFFPGWGC